MNQETQILEKLNQSKQTAQEARTEFAAELTGQKKTNSQKTNLTSEVLTKISVP